MLIQEKLKAYMSSERAAAIIERALAYENSDTGVSHSCETLATTPSQDEEMIFELIEECSDIGEDDCANLADYCRQIAIAMLEANAAPKNNVFSVSAYDDPQRYSITTYFIAHYAAAMRAYCLQM